MAQSMKQQIYQQIANSQVQQVMAQKREQELAALQADFSSFMEQQKNPEALMADFNTFMESQKPVQQPTVSEVQKIPSLSEHQNYVNKAVEERKRLAELDKQRIAKENTASMVQDLAKAISGNTLPKEKKEEKKIRNSKLEDYQRQQQAENMLASPKVSDKAEKWLSPDYKLTEEDKKAAKKYAQAELRKLDYDSNKKPVLKTAEDRQHYADMVNLLNKTNSFTNFMEGYIQPALGIGNAVRDASIDLAKKTTNLGNSITDGLGITGGAVARNNEKIAALEDFYKQNAKNIKQADLNAQIQNPKGYGAGNFAGQVSLYALTNPAFDALGKVAGAGKVGSALLNQVGQNAQDLVINTIPKINEYREGGFTPEETADIWKGIGRDARQNLVMAGAGEIASNIMKNKAAKKASDAAFRANVREGAEKLAKLAGTEPAENVVESATKQAEEAIENIKNISKQIPKVPEEPRNYIPSPEELRELEREASVMDEAEDLSNIWKSDVDTKGLRPHATNQGVSPSIDNAAEELSKQMDAPKYSVDAGVDNPNLTREANDAINSYLFQLEDPFNNPKVDDAVGGLISKVTSDNGFKLMDDYNELSRQLRESVEDNPAIREQLAELRKGINSVDKAEREAVKDLLDYADIQNAIADYKKALNGMDEEAIDRAAKSLDAARNRVARRNNADATLKEAFGGSYGPIINRPKNAFEIKPDEAVVDDMVADWVKQDMENPNRFVSSAEPDTKVKEHLGGKVMAEDTGIPKGTPEPESDKLTIEIPDTPENAPIAPKPEVQPTEPNMKVSETYTNTGRRGGGWNAEEYSKYTDPQNYTYETIDELRSVEEATNMRATEGREAFKNRVLNADRVSSIELDGLMMEWRELTEEARALETAGEDASKLWEESNRIFRKVQTQSTSNAQALQVLAKWSRNTPEGMLLNAENIVNGKTKANKTELQKFIDKHFKNKKGEIQFSPEFEKEFLNTAESLRGLSGTQLDSREAKEAMAKLGKMVNEQLPVKLNEKLQSFLMDNMLGNFRTLITRNAGGNLGLNVVEQTLERPLAAGIDSLVSLKTGKRTQAGLSKAGLVEYIQGFGKGLADEGKDFKSGLHTARSGENTLENAIRANRHVFKTKVADGLDGLVKHGLSVGDRPYYEAVYKQTLGDYQRLFDRGLLGKDIQSLSPEDFKAYSETAAKMNALGAVYQQDTMLSKALLDLKKGVGELSDGILGVDILSQFSMPFVKTPANVIERAIDYSPLGVVRNAFRTGKEMGAGAFDQNRFVNEASRNILGTALMGGGAAYAANGGMSGKYSKNKNEKQAQKEAGMQEYAWNVPNWIPALGGMQMDIGWLPVVGSNLVAAAAAIDAYKNGEGSFGENLTSGLQAGGKALFDQSMFQGLQRLFGTGEAYNSDEGIVGNMKNVVTSGVGQAIPSLLRQVAQVTDENQRDLAYSNEGTSFGPFDNYAINSLANNLPYVRQNYLAPKVDTSGNLLQENQGRNVGMKILEDMVLPGKLTNVNMSPLAQEASRLSGATDSAFIPKADRTAIDSEEHTLSNEEWVLYQQDYYKKMTEAGEKMLGTELYKNSSEETQAKLLHNLYSDIKSAINSDYTGKELSGAAKVYKEQGLDATIDYVTQSQMVSEAGLSNNEANRKLAQTGGQEALNKVAQMNEAISSLGLDINDTTKAIYNQYGDQGLNDYNYFSKYEEKSEAFNRYQYAKKNNSSKSAQQFDRVYSQIDGKGNKGNKNGSVTQDEMLAFFNQQGIKDEQTALDYWYTYGKYYTTDDNWAKIPVLKNGTWVAQKKK